MQESKSEEALKIARGMVEGVKESYRERLKKTGRYRDLAWLEDRIKFYSEQQHPDHMSVMSLAYGRAEKMVRAFLNQEAERKPLTKEELKMPLSLERMAQENHEEIARLETALKELEIKAHDMAKELEHRRRIQSTFENAPSAPLGADLPEFDPRERRRF